MEAYKELETRFRRLALINEARAMLGWDWATMMPTGAAESRVEQMAELSLVVHEFLLDPRVEELLDEAELGVEMLDDWRKSNLKHNSVGFE